MGYSPRSQSGREQAAAMSRTSSSPNVQVTTPQSQTGARPKSQMFTASSAVPSPTQGGRETSAEGEHHRRTHQT